MRISDWSSDVCSSDLCTETPLTVLSSRSFRWDANKKGERFMRKLAIVVALSSTVLATPALARDGAWYVGGEFGAMLVEDYDVRIAGSAGDENLPGSNGQIRVYHDFGYDGALFAGYDLGGARIEAEVSYKKAQIRIGKAHV